METERISSKQLMIYYGVILGIITVLVNVTNFALGKTYDQHWSVGVVSFIVMAAIIVMGIKKGKESDGGFLKLGQALKIGLGIALISGIISVIYTLTFTSFIEPDYFETLVQVQEQKWLEANMSDEEIDMAKSMMTKMSGPGMTSAFTIIGSLFIGFVVSLIGGLIMQRPNEEITSI